MEDLNLLARDLDVHKLDLRCSIQFPLFQSFSISALFVGGAIL